MARKISRREERARRRTQEKQRNRLLVGGGIGLVAVIIAVAAYSQLNQPTPTSTITPGGPTTNGPQFVPEEGAEHINLGVTPPYAHTSNPPTSGWHYSQPQPAGFYDQPIEDGYLGHSLEHGYVIISYNCATLIDAECEDLKTKLQDLFNRKAPGAGFSAWKLIVVPRPELDTVIALTAWTWIDKFNEYDEQRIIDFIDRFRDHGPEATPS